MIICTKCSLQQLIGFLGLYEEESESGQLINKDKSCYIVIVLEVTGFKRRNLPVKYLGCSLFTGRKQIDYFNDLLKKFEKKLAGWKAEILSTGGRITLIKHVLQSLSLYNVAALDPPKTVLNRIEGICANFLWGEGDNGFKYHWVGWKKCCYPFQEGGPVS